MGDIDEKADTYPPDKDQRNLNKLSTHIEKEQQVEDKVIFKKPEQKKQRTLVEKKLMYGNKKTEENLQEIKEDKSQKMSSVDEESQNVK